MIGSGARGTAHVDSRQARPVTRIAPTPSGYLHLGNAVNFQLVAWLADQLGAVLVLRIDDMDAVRYRREYVDDVFAVLDWLAITPDRGPRSTQEFEDDFSLQRRAATYRDEAQGLLAAGHAYVCQCTRREVGPSGVCTSDCALRDRELIAHESALRLRMPADLHHAFTTEGSAAPEPAADPILWRRDDLPAYHLASVIEDRDQAVTHIVRGEDLRGASVLHRYLATLLNAQGLASAHFAHHPLVMDEQGAKLSKSRLSAGPMELSDRLRDHVRELAADMAEPLGIQPATS